MTVLSQSWEMRAGEDKSVTFTVPSDLTGCTASWTLREERGSPALLTKAGAVTGGASSTVVVALVKADTLTLAGVYWHQCVATDIALAEEVIVEGWVTILAPAAVGLYCSVETLKRRISVADTDDDAELERIITAVSREIDNYCGRRFYAASETRYYTASHPCRLTVDDLLAVTTLATDGDGDRTYEDTWAVTDFDLTPDNAALDGRPYWAIETAPAGDYSFPVGVRKGVKIVGSIGYSATTPPVVEDACLAQCKLEYDARNAHETMEGVGNPSMKVSLHPFVKDVLNPLRRLSVA